MNRQYFKILAIAAIVVSATFTSCIKDEPELTLGSEIVDFFAIPTDAQTVNIQSKIEWSVAIEQTDDWLGVTPMSGYGNATLTITSQDNDDFELQRNATITVTGIGIQAKTIAVMQKSAVIQTKQIFNKSLNDFINVRFLSLQETAGHASHTYKSTVAVTYLTEILEKAKYVTTVKPKPENKNQQRFSEMIVMQHSKKVFGKIKLTVGVLKGSRQKVQYCITAIE